jgi:hypothetical protein
MYTKNRLWHKNMVNFGENGFWFQCMGLIGQVHKNFKWMGEIIKFCRILVGDGMRFHFGMICGIGGHCEGFIL